MYNYVHIFMYCIYIKIYHAWFIYSLKIVNENIIQYYNVRLSFLNLILIAISRYSYETK